MRQRGYTKERQMTEGRDPAGHRDQTREKDWGTKERWGDTWRHLGYSVVAVRKKRVVGMSSQFKLFG
jgi:hypothetical protein